LGWGTSETRNIPTKAATCEREFHRIVPHPWRQFPLNIMETAVKNDAEGVVLLNSGSQLEESQETPCDVGGLGGATSRFVRNFACIAGVVGRFHHSNTW
jgi:hypothetical protein